MEFLVFTFIVFILIGIAGVQYPKMTESFDKSNSRTSFEYDLRRARAQALANGKLVIFDFNTAGDGYSFGYDTRPYNDPLAYDESSFSRTLPNTVSITSNATLAFDSRGFLTDVDGDIVTATVTLSHKGVQYCEFDVFPTGEAELNCD